MPPTKLQLTQMFPGEQVEIVGIIPIRVFLDRTCREAPVSLEVPVFSERCVPAGYCSRYVRYAGKILFKKEYRRGPAWNRRYKDKLVAQITKRQTLKQLAFSGVLQPGMIIGVFYPSSTQLNETDQKGMPAKYTHNSLYLGKDAESLAPCFAEQFIKTTRISREEDFYKERLIPREVIRQRDDKRS